jgi:hypothetical protein
MDMIDGRDYIIQARAAGEGAASHAPQEKDVAKL